MRRLGVGVMMAAALAGCGGSDSGDGDARQSTSRSAGSEFVRSVDSLCRDANPDLARIQTSLTTTRDANRAGRLSAPEAFKTFATLLNEATVITDRFQRRLRAIEVPEDERAFQKSLLASVEDGSANLRRQVSAANAQDARRLSELSVAGTVINAKQKGLIKGHGGFRVCGRD